MSKPDSNFILDQAEDGRTRIENETVLLTQKLMAELFGDQRQHGKPSFERDLR